MGDSKPIRRAILGVLCGLAPASIALAQQASVPQIEEIIVTAQKRTQSLQEVPVAVSAFSGLPPSPGGLNRGSRHVPVHVGGSAGSMTALACVSL